MTAVDTSILVRLLIEDDPGQAKRARALFEAAPVWISKTVLLETAWVLRSVYEFDREAVNSALAQLVGIPNVKAEDALAVDSALRWANAGLEFADAIHLASRPPGTKFASLDESLCRRARRMGIEIDALST